MCIGGRDKGFDKTVAAKMIRDSRLVKPNSGVVACDQVVSGPVAGGSKVREEDVYSAVEEVSSDKFEDNSSENDEEFEISAPRYKKSETVSLTVNAKELAKLTSVTCKIYKIGSRAQSDILTNVSVAGGGSTESIPCSRSTVRRAGIAAVTDTVQNIKKRFQGLIGGE